MWPQGGSDIGVRTAQKPLSADYLELSQARAFLGRTGGGRNAIFIIDSSSEARRAESVSPNGPSAHRNSPRSDISVQIAVDSFVSGWEARSREICSVLSEMVAISGCGASGFPLRGNATMDTRANSGKTETNWRIHDRPPIPKPRISVASNAKWARHVSALISEGVFEYRTFVVGRRNSDNDFASATFLPEFLKGGRWRRFNQF